MQSSVFFKPSSRYHLYSKNIVQALSKPINNIIPSGSWHYQMIADSSVVDKECFLILHCLKLFTVTVQA